MGDGLTKIVLEREGKNLRGTNLLTNWFNENIESFINSAPPGAKYMVAVYKGNENKTESMSVTYFDEMENVKRFMQENPISFYESINPVRTWP